MKKIVSILLVVTCLFTAMIFPNTASAENEYKILFKNEEVTDTQGLLNLYKAQERVKAYNALMENENLPLTETEEDPNQITVGQILEAREYKDGRREYTAAVSGISAIKDGRLVPATTTYTENYGESGQWNMVHVTCKAYISFYYDNSMFAKLHKVGTTLNNKSMADSVTIRHAYKIVQGFGSVVDCRDEETFTPTLHVERILVNNKYSGYTRVDHNIQDAVTAACEVKINGVKYFEIQLMCEEIRDFCFEFMEEH